MFEVGQTVRHTHDYIREHSWEDPYAGNWRGEVVKVDMRKLVVVTEDEYGCVEQWAFHEVELADA